MPIGVERLSGEYEVGKDLVVLRIFIGEGQFGSSAVLLGEGELASGSLAMVRVGEGVDLKGERLTITSTVTDVQRLTNLTSVTYVLSGGPRIEEHHMERDVEEEGGSVIYIAELDLV
jgi:hypothetical protein